MNSFFYDKHSLSPKSTVEMLALIQEYLKIRNTFTLIYIYMDLTLIFVNFNSRWIDFAKYGKKRNTIFTKLATVSFKLFIYAYIIFK